MHITVFYQKEIIHYPDNVPKKLVRIIQMCLSETHSRVRVGNQLSDTFEIYNVLKQGNDTSPLLFNFALRYAIISTDDNRKGLELMALTSCWCMLMT